MESNYDRSIQLCEGCRNSCGKCKWSAFGKPVDGWVAIPTLINSRGGGGERVIESFLILSCPKYIPDGPRHTETLTNEGVMKLISRILIQAVRDYANGCVRARKNGSDKPTDRISLITRRWFFSPIADDMFDALGLDMDPQVLVERIEADPHGVLQRINIEYHSGGVEPNEIAERKQYT